MSQKKHTVIGGTTINVGDEMSFSAIEALFDENDKDLCDESIDRYNRDELGFHNLGKQLMIYEDGRDNVVSFVLSSATGKEYFYTCVYIG